MSGRTGFAVDGLVLLTGLYCAISPWTTHFSGDLRAHNLIVGTAVAVFGLCLALAPQRIGGLGWALAATGVWLIISPWVVTVGSPDAGMIWNNIVLGVITLLCGLFVASMMMRRGKREAA